MERFSSKSLVAQLILVESDGSHGAAHEFHSDITIGREKNCDVRIKVPSISRKHANINIDENGQFVLQHISTTNASLVNGKVSMLSILHDGDVLTFGERNFLFRLQSQQYQSPLVKSNNGLSKHIPSLETIEEGGSANSDICKLIDGHSSSDKKGLPHQLKDAIQAKRKSYGDSTKDSVIDVDELKPNATAQQRKRLPLSILESIQAKRLSTPNKQQNESNQSFQSINQQTSIPQIVLESIRKRRKSNNGTSLPKTPKKTLTPLRLKSPREKKENTLKSCLEAAIQARLQRKEIQSEKGSSKVLSKGLPTPVKKQIQKLRTSIGCSSAVPESIQNDYQMKTCETDIGTSQKQNGDIKPLLRLFSPIKKAIELRRRSNNLPLIVTKSESSVALASVETCTTDDNNISTLHFPTPIQKEINSRRLSKKSSLSTPSTEDNGIIISDNVCGAAPPLVNTETASFNDNQPYPTEMILVDQIGPAVTNLSLTVILPSAIKRAINARRLSCNSSSTPIIKGPFCVDTSDREEIVRIESTANDPQSMWSEKTLPSAVKNAIKSRRQSAKKNLTPHRDILLDDTQQCTSPVTTVNAAVTLPSAIKNAIISRRFSIKRTPPNNRDRASDDEFIDIIPTADEHNEKQTNKCQEISFQNFMDVVLDVSMDNSLKHERSESTEDSDVNATLNDHDDVTNNDDVKRFPDTNGLSANDSTLAGTSVENKHSKRHSLGLNWNLGSMFRLPLDYVDATYVEYDEEFVEIYAKELEETAGLECSMAYEIALDTYMSDPIMFRHKIGNLLLPEISSVELLKGSHEIEIENCDNANENHQQDIENVLRLTDKVNKQSSDQSFESSIIKNEMEQIDTTAKDCVDEIEIAHNVTVDSVCCIKTISSPQMDLDTHNIENNYEEHKIVVLENENFVDTSTVVSQSNNVTNHKISEPNEVMEESCAEEVDFNSSSEKYNVSSCAPKETPNNDVTQEIQEKSCCAATSAEFMGPRVVIIDSPSELVCCDSLEKIKKSEQDELQSASHQDECTSKMINPQRSKKRQPICEAIKPRGKRGKKVMEPEIVIATDASSTEFMEEALAILCDRCDAEYFVDELGLTEIPEGDWYCSTCIDSVSRCDGRKKRKVAFVELDEKPNAKKSKPELQQEVKQSATTRKTRSRK